VVEAGLSRLVFKAPTKGLSLHLGFDYVGEHKMGPLSIAMFLVKQNNGLPLQAALSVVAAKTIKGAMTNTAIITTGPSLHGKSTMTIMLELAGSDLARLVGLSEDPNEGVYPMNDDIVLLQPTSDVIETSRGGHHLRLSYGIDGTENSFYAVPFGLTPDQDPITYEVLRGTPEEPNPLEILENVVVDPATGIPDFLQNPTRNMRMILSRSRLVERKGAGRVLQAITRGHMADSAHVPLQDVDRVFWQAVTRLNTIVPPLRRLNLKQYVRCLMYGEAVQMGAAIGAIGKPYVEYFSDPFIIGLEDENANLLFEVLQEMERDGQQQQFYVFNTGGIGADSDEGASGPKYKKIPRELTLMLQEALLRGAVKFEHDALLGSEFAAAIVNRDSEEVMNLRHEWLPRAIYGQAEYKRRVVDLERKRFYGRDSNDKSGILRYTKVSNALIDFLDIPSPRDERELAWLLSFYWYVDMAYGSLAEFLQHMHEGLRPTPYRLRALQRIYRAGPLYQAGLPLESQKALKALGIG
jgi:hypothetical protein